MSYREGRGRRHRQGCMGSPDGRCSGRGQGEPGPEAMCFGRKSVDMDRKKIRASNFRHLRCTRQNAWRIGSVHPRPNFEISQLNLLDEESVPMQKNNNTGTNHFSIFLNLGGNCKPKSQQNHFHQKYTCIIFSEIFVARLYFVRRNLCSHCGFKLRNKE